MRRIACTTCVLCLYNPGCLYKSDLTTNWELYRQEMRLVQMDYAIGCMACWFSRTILADRQSSGGYKGGHVRITRALHARLLWKTLERR